MSGTGPAPTTYAVHAACIRGVEACPITVEVAMAGGIPGMSVVGMADTSIMESRSRIRCALRTAGYDIPRKSITVSLAPADMRKAGSGLDLPIAVAVLAASGQIPREGLDGCLIVGELGLDGSVSGVKGEVAYQLLARDSGLSLIGGRTEGHVSLPGADHGYLDDLAALRGGIAQARREFHASAPAGARRPCISDLGDVIGQEVAKRALAVAAAGGLGMLMVGAPGAGKSMLARRMGAILPAIDERERNEALCIHSVAGEPLDALLAGERPFRAPHHSISVAGMVGGGRPVRPGEISLAHGGVLFLDELAEFPNATLQSLRQPLEEGTVRIVRAEGAYAFPARFQLLAASNPCPCGFLGDREVACRCSDAAVERYRSKLGGPLADRIDLIVAVERPDPALIVRGVEGMTTEALRVEVERARSFRSWRLSGREAPELSGESPFSASLKGFDGKGADALLEIARTGHLTGRGIARLVRIARTVADMDESEGIGPAHVLEASMLQGRRGDERI